MNVKKYRSSKSRPRKPRAKKVYARGGRFGNPRSTAPVQGNFARSVESVVYEDLTPNTGIVNVINLQDFARSTDLAQYYQWYRITEVKYDYQPFSDTFQEGPSTGAPSTSASAPQMYYIMDRSGRYDTATTPFTLQTIVEQGAKPRKFTKNITIKYKPNTLILNTIGGSDGTVIASAPQLKFNSWISTYQPAGAGTTPRILPYYGHIVWFDQETGTASLGRLTITVTIEFKQPLSLDDSSPLAKPAVRVQSLQTN